MSRASPLCRAGLLLTGSRLTYSFDIFLKLHSYGSGPAWLGEIPPDNVILIQCVNYNYKHSLHFPTKYDIYVHKLITVFRRATPAHMNANTNWPGKVG